MPADKLPELEGVRGLAAATVVLCHVLGAFAPPDAGGVPTLAGGWPAGGHELARLLLHPAGDGRLAVSVFFVLSGLVLSRGYLTAGRGDLGAACVRRFVRLGLPAAAAVMLAWACWAGGLVALGPVADRLEATGMTPRWLRLMGPPDLSATAGLVEGGWGLYAAAPDKPAHRQFNPPLWTMRVEMYGSLVVYAFLALFGRHPRVGRLAGLAAGLAAVGGWVYPSLFPAGVGLSAVRRDRPADGVSLPLGAGLAAAALWLGGLGEHVRDWRVPVPVVGRTVDSLDLFASPAAVLLVAAVLFCRPLAAALAVRPLVGLGGVSFGLYLAHFPVLATAGAWAFLAAAPLGHGPAVLVAGAVTAVGSLAVGWWLTVFADRPAAALGRWLAGRLLASPPVVTPGRPATHRTPAAAS